MKVLLLAALLLGFSTPALAGTKHSHAKAAPASGSVWDTLYESFTVHAGFRWESNDSASDESVPFFVGAGLSVPFSENVAAFGTFDHDLGDDGEWQVRAGVELSPFKGN